MTVSNSTSSHPANQRPAYHYMMAMLQRLGQKVRQRDAMRRAYRDEPTPLNGERQHEADLSAERARADFLAAGEAAGCIRRGVAGFEE